MTREHSAEPVVGLIVPYATATLPPEAMELYPTGIRFIAQPATVSALEETAYARAMELVLPAAMKLKEAGADAICVRGTSLTFFRGADFNTQLIETIRGETGLPTTTLSSGIVEGLRAVGAQRISVCTAYDERVNERLNRFLLESGFEVEVLEGLQIVEFDAVRLVSEEAITEFALKVHQRAAGADAMLISCGGLRTVNITTQLESEIQRPVISSNTAGIWSAVRLAGHSGQSPGFGMLFEMDVPATL